MNLDWYYTFLVLAKHLNYHRASEELFLTEPTLHQQIKKLEKHLQVKLFEPIGRKIALTSVGKDFVPIASNIVRTYEAGIEKIRLQNHLKSNHLDILVSPYIATYLLPQFLPLFLAQKSEITISIAVVNSDIPIQIEEGMYDIGIDREEPLTNKIYSEKICEGKIALFAPKDERYQDEMSIFQNYKIFSDNHPSYWKQIKEEIFEIVPEVEFVSIEDISITEKLIAMKQGASYLPLYLNNIFNFPVQIIKPKLIEMPTSFTYIMNRKQTQPIEDFKEFFKEFIQKEQQRTQ